ncbi:hypothetical protein LD125_00690 [Mesoplasma sp. JKS002658]|uniref:hypothetical protein n=1 Tax=Mesoplasma whartonense TaxID=2878854 RepID=UPI002022A0D5|nr:MULTISPECIES: hypothetical protein [unclassified Mesoplasma]MCL8211590.1 hypothetical protein [Mesoplasma sp. JKS002664]MCL8212329.1 hypothetical protein [Mesoplasma sp. JKS002662]MCL8212831.1 hypothetical protein [Mesoplasma sp. JKS002661]MCL8213477.1 hypothetical protein [Mesoplasma sp. JKS002660]MCL8214426.1 hypothetical protein [Mesoplasma sp. JKS002658]
MIIKNYKRLNYVKFNLTKTKIILNKDYLERKDLLEVLNLTFNNKKIPEDAVVKWEENDLIYNLKNLKVINIPNLIDFEKDFFDGSKSIVKTLIQEVLQALEYQNKNLIELESLLFSFKLENELESLNNLFKEIKSDYHLSLKTNLIGSIAQVLSDYLELEMLNQNDERLTEDNITFELLNNLYFKLLNFIIACMDNQALVIFDNPFTGIKYQDLPKIMSLINKIDYKILVLSEMPLIDDKNLSDVFIFGEQFLLDFSEFYNNLEDIQKFIDQDVEPILNKVSQNIVQQFNVYDYQYEKMLLFNDKSEEILFTAIKNYQIV